MASDAIPDPATSWPLRVCDQAGSIQAMTGMQPGACFIMLVNGLTTDRVWMAGLVTTPGWHWSSHKRSHSGAMSSWREGIDPIMGVA